MKNLTADKIIGHLDGFFKQRAAGYCIEMVFLYGSWASGYPRGDSDIDLAIRFYDTVGPLDKIHFLLTEISYALFKELNQEVDIISLDKDFSHPMLYYNAIISGIPVYIEDNDKFLSLKLEAIHQMEDFQSFGATWQRQITDKIMREVINGRI